MEENTINNSTTGEENSIETTNDCLVKFNKPYVFEDTTYTELDLSALENISTKDLLATDKLYYQTGNIAPQIEVTLAYVCIVASKVTKKPLEFFYGLPAKESMKVKTVVTNFLFN